MEIGGRTRESMKKIKALVCAALLSGYFEIDRLRQSTRSIFGRFGSPDILPRSTPHIILVQRVCYVHAQIENKTYNIVATLPSHNHLYIIYLIN